MLFWLFNSNSLNFGWNPAIKEQTVSGFTKMADDELAQIREKRMAELKVLMINTGNGSGSRI